MSLSDAGCRSDLIWNSSTVNVNTVSRVAIRAWAREMIDPKKDTRRNKFLVTDSTVPILLRAELFAWNGRNEGPIGRGHGIWSSTDLDEVDFVCPPAGWRSLPLLLLLPLYFLCMGARWISAAPLVAETAQKSGPLLVQQQQQQY